MPRHAPQKSCRDCDATSAARQLARHHANGGNPAGNPATRTHAGRRLCVTALRQYCQGNACSNTAPRPALASATGCCCAYVSPEGAPCQDAAAQGLPWRRRRACDLHLVGRAPERRPLTANPPCAGAADPRSTRLGRCREPRRRLLEHGDQTSSAFARRPSATAAKPIADAPSGTKASAGTLLKSHAAPLTMAIATAPP